MLSKTPPLVRTAGPADATECYRLLLLAHAENAIFPANNQKVAWWIQQFLHAHKMPPGWNGPRGVVGVIGEVGGALEAICVIRISEMWYTDARYLEEFLVFIDPAFRRTGHARAVIDWMKGQADKTGLPLMTGVLSNQRTEAKVRLYERVLPKVGAFFLYKPDGWFHEQSIVCSSAVN